MSRRKKRSGSHRRLKAESLERRDLLTGIEIFPIASDDQYSTPAETPLSVPALTGVLQNDAFGYQVSFELPPNQNYAVEGAFDQGTSFLDRFAVPDNTNADRAIFQSGFDGGFAIMGQNFDFEGGDPTRTVSVLGLNVTGGTELEATLSLGAGASGYEGTDGIKIFSAIDGSFPPTLIGAFAPHASLLKLDTNGDGVGDGPTLNSTLTDYTFPIAGSGIVLDITIEVTSDDVSEILALDNLRVNGKGIGTATNVQSPTANNGTVTLQPDGSFTYDPPSGFTGDDTFTYDYEVGSQTDQAIATVTVGAGSTLTVSSTADSGPGSLREAITTANTSPNDGGPDVIEFDFPGPGPHLITLATALPLIDEAIIIDGTTEPDFSGSPVIQIDGGNKVTDGLLVTGGGSTVRGLSLTGFVDAGLEFFGNSANTASDNYFGITPGGVARGNRFGVKVINSSDNVVSSNVVSGNRDNGVFINGAQAAGNVVNDNRIGSDPAGMARVPNLRHGVALFAPDNFVTNNLISGNNGWGVFTRFSTGGGNLIDGNHIGVDVTGLAPLANASGIQIRSPSNVISGNTVSGNVQGVIIANADSSGTTIQGNLIGTDPTGTVDVGNSVFGVGVFASQLTMIGGVVAGEGNVISGNGLDGVILARSAATDNSILGNKIGTNAAGSSAIPNDGDGVRIVQGASLNVVASNLISGNGVRGVAIDGTNTSDNTIDSNFIGTTNLGGGTLHNANNVAVLITAPNNLITGNVVSAVDAAIVAFTSKAVGNTISGNDIGSDPALATPDGIHLLNGAAGNSIFANTVANGERGIILTNSGNGNDISQNVIFGNTQIGIDLGGDGVTPNDGADGDEGENRLQDTPTVTSATVINGTDIEITYFVSSHPSVASFPMRIEFFASDDGQARILLGTDIYSLSDRTAGSKTITLLGSASLLAVGDGLTATATDDEGNTSELSLMFPIALIDEMSLQIW